MELKSIWQLNRQESLATATAAAALAAAKTAASKQQVRNQENARVCFVLFCFVYIARASGAMLGLYFALATFCCFITALVCSFVCFGY